MSTSAQFMDRVLQGHTDGWSSSQQMSDFFQISSELYYLKYVS